ncbi:MAG: hypothetical protein ACYC6Y_12690, partial [Thermoguttaceae bacterium]
MVRRLAFLVGGFSLLFALTANAQEAMFGQLYGLGVHAYFSQDFAGAHEHLTQAIDAGSQDPRAHYFRGLSYLNLGREDEAKIDFQMGAKLEAEDTGANYEVPRALERIQGESRMLVEEYRREARAIALEREMKRRREVYGEMRAKQAEMLQRQIDQAPAIPAGVPAPAGGSNEDPFGVGAAPAPAAPDAATEPAPPESPAEAAPAAPAGADPFATPAAPAEGADPAAPSADPFATPAAPAEPAMAPPAPAADPFGAPAEPAAADNFTSPAPVEAAPAEPAMAPPAPAADPFGAPATPAEPAPAEPAPA